MIKAIVHDPIFLGVKSSAATADDIEVSIDLMDTLKSNHEKCVGMAANMIGIRKKIIAYDDGENSGVMFNPEIINAMGKYETEECCLSLSGTRKAVRYRQIKVRWQNEKMQFRIKSFSGFTAQIIQHEIDHCNGILI